MLQRNISKILDFVKSYDYRLWILTFGWLISAMGFAMVMPFISIYFHSELGIPMSWVGLVFGISAIIRATVGLLGGEFSDLWGRLKIMVFSQVLRAFLFFIIAWFIYRGAGFLLLSSLIILSSLFGGFYQPVAQAMVADVVTRQKRVEAFSIIRIGANLGWAIGPAIGGFVSSVSYPLLFVIGGLTSLVSGFLIWFFVKETVIADENKSRFRFKDLIEIRKDRLFFLYCIISFLLFIVVAQLIATLSVFSVDWVGITKTKLGYLYTLNGLMVTLFQFPMAKFIKRFKITEVLFYGSLLYMLGYTTVGLAGSFAWLFLCMVVITTAEISVMPATMALVANMSPERNRGRYMGIFNFSSSFGWSIGPIVGGVLLDILSGNPFFVWSGISVLALISAFGYRWLGRKLSPEVDLSKEVSQA